MFSWSGLRKKPGKNGRIPVAFRPQNVGQRLRMWGSGSVCGAAAPSADDRKSSRAEPRGHYFFTVYPMISRNFAEQNRSTLLSCLQLQANYSLPRVDGWPLYLPCIRIGFLSILDDEG